ncbi:MAG: prenyltransferase [Desulfobacca sp.]|nr:prenyltransferase [Desulfobacca sp.]
MAAETDVLRWLRWSDLPPLLSGVIALWLGTLLAPVQGYPWRLAVAEFATLALIALMLGFFWIRELYGTEAQSRPVALAISGFPEDVPGCLTGLVSRATLTKLSYSAAVVAALCGLVLQFYFQTGGWTMALMVVALLAGYAAAAPPVRWGSRPGSGLLAGCALGLLPLVAGFYLQSGYWASELFLFALPLMASGACVYLSHEFRDYATDLQAGNRTLVVRLGLVGGALAYTLANILAIIGMVLVILFPATPLPYHQGLWLIILLAVINQEMVKRRKYREPRGQTRLWRLTGLVNIVMGIWFLVMAAARL